MTIKQFNGRYLPQLDRILVKANTDSDEEMSVFMTRRVVRQILEGGEQKSVALEAARRPASANAEVARFKREAIRQNTDFKQPYLGATRQTLGDKPELVLEAVFSAPNSESKSFSELVLSLRSGRKLTLKMPQSTLQALCVLLEKLQEQAQWDLLPKVGSSTGPNASAATPEGSERVIH